MGNEARKEGISRLVSFRRATSGEVVRHTVLVREGTGAGGKEIKVSRRRKKKGKGEKEGRVVVWEKTESGVVPKIEGRVVDPEVEEDWLQR